MDKILNISNFYPIITNLFNCVCFVNIIFFQKLIDNVVLIILKSKLVNKNKIEKIKKGSEEPFYHRITYFT